MWITLFHFSMGIISRGWNRRAGASSDALNDEDFTTLHIKNNYEGELLSNPQGRLYNFEWLLSNN